jgi:23S rRNA (cytidine1920-2'-O)/16S rRNA (cytidine1409-2'-O)-methyltransferase
VSIKKEKKRLDALVQEKYPSLSRNQIQSFIMQGKVLVDGAPITKSGTPISTEATVTLTEEMPKYVSRAGFKLEAALHAFNVDVTGLVVLDAGISTGGFTDCLLQNGATKIYGIDVGQGQVHEKIRSDKRVVLFEQTNLRHLKHLPELVDLVTLDLSFISLLKVMPAVSELIKPNGKIIALIKPQFEAERADVSTGGVIKDEKIHQKVVEKVKIGMTEFGFIMHGIIDSPILGATSGNKEFLALFERNKQ